MHFVEFGFDTSDESVASYRSIFRNYFRSPDDYDAEVIDAVHYFRANRCVFYKAPKIEIGEAVPDVPLYLLNGKDTVRLHAAAREGDPLYTLICAFSMS